MITLLLALVAVLASPEETLDSTVLAQRRSLRGTPARRRSDKVVCGKKGMWVKSVGSKMSEKIHNLWSDRTPSCYRCGAYLAKQNPKGSAEVNNGFCGGYTCHHNMFGVWLERDGSECPEKINNKFDESSHRVKYSMSQVVNDAAVGTKDITWSEANDLANGLKKIRFCIWNSKSGRGYDKGKEKYNAEVLDPMQLAGVVARSDAKRTEIFIHGFTSNAPDSMEARLTHLGADKDDWNIIGLDWRAIAGFQGGLDSLWHGMDGYIFPQHSTGKVGVHAAKMLKKFLEANNIDYRTVIVTGHSLGAHVGGMLCRAYRALSGNEIQRFTGLDPAAPGYACDSSSSSCTSSDYNKPNKFVPWAMRKTDAAYTVVIHTNGGLQAPYVTSGYLGTAHYLGDSDWYFNGGQKQITDICPHGPNSCSHTIAPEFAARAAFNGNGYKGKQCGPTATACTERRLIGGTLVSYKIEYTDANGINGPVGSFYKPKGGFYVETSGEDPWYKASWRRIEQRLPHEN